MPAPKASKGRLTHDKRPVAGKGKSSKAKARLLTQTTAGTTDTPPPPPPLSADDLATRPKLARGGAVQLWLQGTPGGVPLWKQREVSPPPPAPLRTPPAHRPPQGGGAAALAPAAAPGLGPVFDDPNQPRRGSGSEQGTAEQHTCEPNSMEPFTLEHNSVANSNDPGGRGCSFERDPPTCNRSSQDKDDYVRGAPAVPGSLSCSPQPRGPRDPEHTANDACGAAASDSPPFEWEFDPVRQGAGAEDDSPPFHGAEWEFDPVRKGAGAAPGCVNHSPQHVHPRGESGGRAASGSPMLPQEDGCINMPLPAAAAALQ